MRRKIISILFVIFLTCTGLTSLIGSATETNNPLWEYDTGGIYDVNDVAMSSDGNFLTAVSEDLYFWQKDDSTPQWIYDDTSSNYGDVSISSDGVYIAVSNVFRLKFFDNNVNHQPQWEYEGGGFGSNAISSDGIWIVAGGWSSHKIFLFNRNQDDYYATPDWTYDTGGIVDSVDISSDGEYIVAGSKSNYIYVFDKDSSSPLWSYETVGKVKSVAISDDGNYIVATCYGNNGNKAYLFERSSSDPIWIHDIFAQYQDSAISSDGSYIAVAAGFLYVFDINGLLWDAGSSVCSVDITSDGNYVVSGSGGGINKIKYFSTSSDSVIWNYQVGDGVKSVAISDDAEYVFASSGRYDGNGGKTYLFHWTNVPDNEPPVPDPSEWNIEPYATGPNSISMKAVSASDSSGGVKYYFEETSGNPGGSDSGWQSSRSYTDDDLLADTQYTYKVKTKDSIGNTGDYSTQKSARTDSSSENEKPNKPSKPQGSNLLITEKQYTFTTKADDPDGDDIKYGWDWNGDDSVDEWTGFYSSGENINLDHSWNNAGTYEIKVKAEDENGAKSVFSQPLSVTVEVNEPPNKPDTPTGPISGYTDQSYAFETKTTDPGPSFDISTKYGWDWNGDGSVDEWTGFYSSGESISTEHSWSNPGTYSIKVKARDMFEEESVFSDSLEVTIEEQFKDVTFDYTADLTDKIWKPYIGLDPDDKDIHFNEGSLQVFNMIYNENDIYFFQDHVGEAYIGYLYTVPIIDEEGILHEARLTVNGDYDQFLSISGFAQIANIDIELFVEEVGSDYNRRKTVYSDTQSGWSLDFLNSFRDGTYSYDLTGEGSLNEDGNIWLYLHLKEGYTYRFWVVLKSSIMTTGLPGELISLITGQPAPSLMGRAKSDNSIELDNLKLEWVDYALLRFSNDGNHRPDIPTSPSYNGENYRVGDTVDFSTYISDPDEDKMYCKWYWGDGTDSGWMGPYSSGRIEIEHLWDSVGNYEVRVETKDVKGVFSGMSSSSSVFINVSEPEGSIDITSPSGDDIAWIKNQEYTISWNCDGDVGDYVSIDLVKKTIFNGEETYELVCPITVVDSGDRSYSWVPNVEPSHNYQIMVYGTNSIDLSDPIEIKQTKTKSGFIDDYFTFKNPLIKQILIKLFELLI